MTINARRFASLASALALLASLSAGCADSPSPDKGPEIAPNTSAYVVAFPAKTTFTDAFQRVLFEGSKGGRLESVKFLGGDGYFEFAGLKVAGVDRKIGSIQFAPNYPPRRKVLGKVVEGEGAYLAPGDVGTLLLVGMRITRDEIGWRTGLRINYSIGDKMYSSVHRSAVVNCPPGTDQARCDEAFEMAFEEAGELQD